MMHPVTSFENLPNEKIIQYTQSLIKTMCDYGLKKTWQIEKLKKFNEPLYEKFCKSAREKYSELNGRYPGIVSMVLGCSSDFNMDRLIRMMGLADKMANGEIPELETHVQISTELRNEYVLPKLNITEDDVQEVDLDPEKLKNFDFGSTNIKF